MITFKGKIKGGKTTLFGYELDRFHKWLAANEGTDFEIREFRAISYSKRKFFEGPVTQYFFYQHEPGVFENFHEARECLKLECNPVRVKTMHGSVITQGGSTSLKSDQWFSNFLERIQLQLFIPNGYEFPDSENYNDWVNSAPAANEVYPPVELLAKNYQRELDKRN